MSINPILLRYSCLSALIVVLTASCGIPPEYSAGINIVRPAENITILLPLKPQIVVSGYGKYTGLKVMVDGVDVSDQIVSTGENRNQGNVSLTVGKHTVTAEAYCQNCGGGQVLLTDTHTFVVASPNSDTHVCTRRDFRSMPPDVIKEGQDPGRKLIAYQMGNGRDTVLIIVDDAPELQQNQMRVELDIDPTEGVYWSKAIEARAGFCHIGSRVDMVEASYVSHPPNVGVACSVRMKSNDYRTDCTITQTMLLNQGTTSELWLRKPYPPFGIWNDVEGIDSSIWQAFGGRSIRVIWKQD